MRVAGCSQGFIAIFLLIVAVVGAVGGAIVGYGLGAFGTQERILAILAAFAAIVLVIAVRHGLSKPYPSLFLTVHEADFPVPFWTSVFFSTLVGGLAGHDLGEALGTPMDWEFGLFSGALAALSMAALMILYFYDNPEKGLEF